MEYNQFQEKIEKICLQTSFEKDAKEEKLESRENFMIEKQKLLASYPVLDDNTGHWPLLHISHSKNTSNSPSQSLSIKKGKSLVILVHGYQGNQYDLEKASNYVSLATNEEKVEIFIVKDMETKKEDIDSMGKHLAHEVRKQILFTTNQFASISFIGYSLGGIIIRAALPYLS